jgi:4-hydroxybenzoate polyprenyltransferase
MKVQAGRDIGRFLVVVLTIVGVVTAALNLTFGGFTPIIWFLLALIVLLVLTCHEVLTIWKEGTGRAHKVFKKR